jgi:hypothetical protein
VNNDVVNFLLTAVAVTAVLALARLVG